MSRQYWSDNVQFQWLYVRLLSIFSQHLDQVGSKEVDYEISRDPDGRYMAFDISEDRPKLLRDPQGNWKFATWEELEAAMDRATEFEVPDDALPALDEYPGLYADGLSLQAEFEAC